MRLSGRRVEVVNRQQSQAGGAVVAGAAVACVGVIAFPVVDAWLTDNPRLDRISTFALLTLVGTVAGLIVLQVRGLVGDRPATTLHWEPLVLLAVLASLWAMVIVDTPHATYFLAMLYLVAAWLLPPVAGLVAIFVLAAFTVAGQIVHHGWTPGAVMGPLVAALLVLASSAALRVVLSDSDAQRRLVAELQEAQAALAASEREAGRLAERTRLGRDLHDTVAQSLSSIQLLLHASERAETREEAMAHVDQARSAAAGTLAETRSFISDLTPPDLAYRSLVVALERVCARAGERGLSTSLEVEGEQRSLPMPVEATLLRIAQEAVENAVAHAGASRCTVTLRFEAGEVGLDVDDDGVGFDAEAALAGGRFGLGGMRSRAADLGGSAVVVSGPGEGTLVAVRLPVDEGAQDG